MDSLQDLELESVIIGTIIFDKNAYVLVQGIISADSFFYAQHRELYLACSELFQSNSPIDLLTVVNQLKKSNKLDAVGGPAQVSSLTTRVASSDNIEAHALMLKELELRRRLVSITDNIHAKAEFLDNDVFELIEKITTEISDLTRFTSTKSKTTKELVNEIIDKIDKARENQGITGVPTNLKTLDEKTGGFQGGDFIIIAGRPGMAKTALALTFANHQALNGIPVGFVSLELTDFQATVRRATLITGVPYQNIIRGKDVYSADFRKDLAPMDTDTDPLYISEDGDLNQICVRIKVWVMDHKVQIVYIDYLQMINVSGLKGKREEMIATISKRLKELAKELRIPIVAIAALNRAAEIRGGDKRPQLSDLRESGQIEYDADMVIFTWRPEYYGIIEGPNGESFENKGFLIIEKHRNGPLGQLQFDFIKHKMLWDNNTEQQLSFMDADNRISPSKPAVETLSQQQIDDLLNKDENKDDAPF
jgi:replicative DNA helicase